MDGFCDGTLRACLNAILFYGAADGSRTRNPRNGSPMLYRLSYSGMKKEPPD